MLRDLEPNFLRVLLVKLEIKPTNIVHYQIHGIFPLLNQKLVLAGELEKKNCEH